MICAEGNGAIIINGLPHPRVVAIDNKRSELENIRDGLLQAGIPCVPLLYDSTEGLITPNGLKTEHVRYIFLDLNLKDTDEHDPVKFIDPISETLKKLHVLGAYVIIFWTSYPKTVEKVMALLKERCPDITLPFFFDTMDKNVLRLPKNPEEDDQGYAEKIELFNQKLAELVETLVKKISGNTMFSALLAWENKVSEAASKSVKTLHDTIRAPQKTGTAQDEKDFCRLLKKLATVAWGDESSKGDWGRSVASGLSPFLSDNLDYSMSTDNNYRILWEKALDMNVAARLPKNVCPHLLNTACALDTTCNVKEAHGVWLEFKLTICPEFISTFGDSGRSFVGEFINTKKLDELCVEYEQRVKLGILDITRPCDYVNRKHGLRRFVLGTIIPDDLSEYIEWDKKDSPHKKHDAIYRFPDVSLAWDGESIKSIIQVNFKYVLSIPDNSLLVDDSVVFARFRVRKQILTDIISKFGAHTTSPGILSFS